MSAIGGEVCHQQTSVTVPTNEEGLDTVPDNGKPAVWGEASLQQTSFAVPTDGKGNTKTPESEEPAERNITVLRRRMEREKVKVLEYIDKKNETELLLDVAMFWKRAEDDNAKREEHSRRLENFRERIQQETLLQGWCSWWTRMEEEASSSRRLDKKRKADVKKASFTNIIIPNLMLVGWRGWWQRMEAEARKDQARLEKEEDWIKSRSQNNRELKSSFIQKYFGIVIVTSLKKEEDSPVEDIGTEISGRHISLTPKRKMSFNHTLTNSVEKKSRQKISTHKLFQEE